MRFAGNVEQGRGGPRAMPADATAIPDDLEQLCRRFEEFRNTQLCSACERSQLWPHLGTPHSLPYRARTNTSMSIVDLIRQRFDRRWRYPAWWNLLIVAPWLLGIALAMHDWAVDRNRAARENYTRNNHRPRTGKSQPVRIQLFYT